MATLSELIDDILARAHDQAERHFTRAEVAKWIAQGYRRLVSSGKLAATFTSQDLPPRHSRAVTFEWEKYTQSGTFRKWTHSYNGSEFTFLWEMQQHAIEPENVGTVAVSNLWEMAYSGSDVDTHYRVMLPKPESGILNIWHDGQRLSPLTSRQLDTTESKWWYIGGEPFVYHQTLGDEGSVEIYNIVTDYYQSFEYKIYDRGIPKSWVEDDHTFLTVSQSDKWNYAYAWTGEPQATDGTESSGIGRRFTYGPTANGYYYTHLWEGDVEPLQADDEANAFTLWFESTSIVYLPIGLFRRALSTSRQYFPSHQWQVKGVIWKLGKSDDALLIHHLVYPEDDTNEQSTLNMIPSQMHKYLIYYALAILLARQGEAYDPIMAQHYEMRAARALVLFKRFAQITRMDVDYVRGGSVRGRTQPPLPSLPATFSRAPWLRR